MGVKSCNFFNCVNEAAIEKATQRTFLSAPYLFNARLCRTVSMASGFTARVRPRDAKFFVLLLEWSPPSEPCPPLLMSPGFNNERECRGARLRCIGGGEIGADGRTPPKRGATVMAVDIGATYRHIHDRRT